jgi:hypothetical protein
VYASVINWSLNPPLRDAADRGQLMRDLARSGIDAAREAGVIDLVMIETEPDLLFGLSLYDTLADAFSSGSTELVEIARLYANRLDLVSRVVGHAYDPPGFDLVDRAEAQQWRDDAEAMYASVATWRLDSSLRAPHALAEYLQEAMERYLPILRRLGLLDMHVVRLADDVILVVHLYLDPIEGNADYQEAVAATQNVLGSKVEFIKGHTGRAYDAPQLLGSTA